MVTYRADIDHTEFGIASQAAAATTVQNLVDNPSFERTTNKWGPCGVSATATIETTDRWATSGTRSARYHNNNTNSCGISTNFDGAATIDPIDDTQRYSASIDLNVTQAPPTGIRLSVTFFDATTALVTCSSAYRTGAGIMHLKVENCDPPAGSITAAVWANFGPDGGGAHPPVDFMADSAMFTLGTTAQPYVDGDRPGGAWDVPGSPHDSPSTGIPFERW